MKQNIFNKIVLKQLLISCNVFVCFISYAQQPSITCPANQKVQLTGNSCTVIVNNIDPVISPVGAEYSYYISSTGQSGFGSASGKAFAVGTSTVTYTLTSDPTLTCSFTVTVEDKIPPVITCPSNITVKCPAEIPLPEDIIVPDPCSQSGYASVMFVSDVRSNETCSNKFILTRTYKATDASGNTATCAQTITVIDDVPPVFNQSKPESPLNVACPFQVQAADVFTATDGCNDEYAAVIFKEVRTDGSCANRYTLTRTWTATDACGNTATYKQIVNVKDTVPPTFNSTPVHQTTVTCASEIPAAQHITAEDNCYDLSALPTVTLKEVISEQQCENKFKLTRTWTATDACGNTATVSQEFIVNDYIRPVFEGSEPGTMSVSCEKDIPAPATQTATDNCGSVTISYSETKTNVQCVNRFTLTRKWIASDGCGNTASRTQVINVYDDQAPKVTTVSATPVVLWPPNHKMRDVKIDYTVADNCGVTSSLEVSSSDPVNGGSDGDLSPDWEVVDDHHVRLRAEKANNGQARYYTIRIRITDGCNNAIDTSVTVVVAHNITSPQTGMSFKAGSNVSFSGVFWDRPANKHTAKWLVDGNAVASGAVTETSGHQNGKVIGNYKFNSPGVYKLQMNVTDQNGVTSYANTNNDLDAIVVIYDPNGGNTYGGGYFESPAGALKGNPTATGKASYGFTMNYFKNSTNPKGETQFEFKVGEFEFNALNFDYLVINNSMAQFKGTGKIIGGQSGVGFTMTVVDGQLDGTGIDKLRMKIYNKNNGQVIYDNQAGVSDAALPTQPVGSNSIIVISGTNANLARVGTSQDMEMETDQKKTIDEFAVIVYPNPSNNHFSIRVQTGAKEKIAMHVTDMYGRVIETRNVNANSITRFGERYNSGTYFVRIIQGKQSKEIKLIKLSD